MVQVPEREGRRDEEGVVVGLVDCTFCLYWCMWHLMVAGGITRCFETSSAVRLGQLGKKTFLMAVIHVDGTGLNHAA